jgi:mRNA interferase MazF
MVKSVRPPRSGTSSAKEPYCPDSGDIIWLDFDSQAGREMARRHAALVVSPRKYNQFARLCLLFPITSKVKGYPFESLFPAEFEIPGSSEQAGCVIADQLKSMSWFERKSDFACRAPDGLLKDAMAKCRTLLPIER